jgi:hypothetical protein
MRVGVRQQGKIKKGLTKLQLKREEGKRGKETLKGKESKKNE